MVINVLNVCVKDYYCLTDLNGETGLAAFTGLITGDTITEKADDRGDGS